MWPPQLAGPLASPDFLSARCRGDPATIFLSGRNQPRSTAGNKLFRPTIGPLVARTRAGDSFPTLLLGLEPDCGELPDRLAAIWYRCLKPTPIVDGLKEFSRKPDFKPCGFAPVPSCFDIGLFFFCHGLDPPCGHPIVRSRNLQAIRAIRNPPIGTGSRCPIKRTASIQVPSFGGTWIERKGEPTVTKINTTRVLANLANEIRALEQKNALNERETIKNIIGIGKRLHDASEIPGTHGEYMDWVASEFPSWSHQTSLNYRNVYELVDGSTEIQTGLESGSLNLTISALYIVAAMKGDDEQNDRMAIIEAAKQGRVTRSKAKQIIELKKAALDAEMRELRERQEKRRTPPADLDPVEPD